MQKGYDALAGYQMETEVTEYRDGAVREKKSFLYSFRKPRQFRVDMGAPHQGTVLVYSERDGKVVVRPGGVGRFMALRLSPDNRLLVSPSGQRIDQTDLGLLIANIGRSVGSERRAEVTVRRGEGRIVLETVANDHFLPDVLTRYRFVIDAGTFLPVEVTERTPEGVLKRVVLFRNLKSVERFPDRFFADGEEGSDGR